MVFEKWMKVGECRAGCEVRVYCRHNLPIKNPRRVNAAIISTKCDVNCCSVKNPVSVRPRHKDLAILLDSVKDLAAVISTDALRCQQTDSSLVIDCFDLPPTLFKPIATEVGSAGNVVVILNCCDICV